MLIHDEQKSARGYAADFTIFELTPTVHDHFTYLLEYRPGKYMLKHVPRFFFLSNFAEVVLEIELNL